MLTKSRKLLNLVLGGMRVVSLSIDSKTVTLRIQKIGFQDQLLLNAGQKYCRMLQGEHRPSLSYHLSLRSLFCLFLSGHLLY